MKGVIFNILEEVVTDQFGADTWDALLEAAGLDGVYTALGNYGDDQLEALVAAAAHQLGLSQADVLRFVGRESYPRLVARHPRFPADLVSSRQVLRSLDDVIHPQVLALYPGAAVPSFTADERSPTEMVLHYSSRRGLCHLAEGLALGAALAYEEPAEVVQEECRLEGGTECRILVRYEAPGA